MAPSMKSLVRATPEFLLARFPFVNALSLIMLLAERAGFEKQPPMSPKMIYAQIAVFLVCGFLLSSRSRRKESSLVYAGQLLYFAHNMYTNQELKYTQWQRIRMATRHLGCAGMFILYSFMKDAKHSVQLRKIGEVLVGLFLFSFVYILNDSSEDKQAFSYHIFGDNWSRYLFSLILACASMCFFSGHFLRDISMSVTLLLIISTLFIDCDLWYWTEKRGMHHWNQIRIISDDVCLILGFMMLTVRFDNKVKME